MLYAHFIITLSLSLSFLQTTIILGIYLHIHTVFICSYAKAYYDDNDDDAYDDANYDELMIK